MNRRRFLTGVAGLLAAPAIVRAGSLMPVSVWKPDLLPERLWVWAEDGGTMRWVRTNWGRADMGAMRIASVPETDWALGRYRPLYSGTSQCGRDPEVDNQQDCTPSGIWGCGCQDILNTPANAS